VCSNHPDPLSPSTQVEPRVNRRLRLTPCPEMEEEGAEAPNNPPPVGSGAAGASSSRLPPVGLGAAGASSSSNGPGVANRAAGPSSSNQPLVTATAGPSQQVRCGQQQEGMSQRSVWFIAVCVPLRTQLVWFNERQPPYQG
jgi:hypothetical protein